MNQKRGAKRIGKKARGQEGDRDRRERLARGQKGFVVVIKLLSHVLLFVTPWTAECQASLSSTIFRSLLKFMSIEW